MKIDVVGAGAWGTALALHATRGAPGRPAHTVRLWARDPAQAQAMQAARVNARYLDAVALPDALQVHALPAAAQLPVSLGRSELLIIATPIAGLRPTLSALRGLEAPVAWLCKGFESRSATDGEPSANGRLGHEIQAEVAPALCAGVLSGPSFALEVARGQPTALVAASAHARVRDALVSALHGPSLRVYASDDVIGVEVGGAVKNVLAIATGLCDGLALGLNARAALITRGLAEMTRLGLALGARAETFMGLSGLGDLVLTATGDLSRNRRVGLLLAQGQSLAQAVASLGHVAEGVACAHTVVQRARALGVDMPISEGVVDLLEGRRTPAEVLTALMARDPKDE